MRLGKIDRAFEAFWRWEKFWKWYLRFAFGAGFVMVVLGIIEFLVWPEMMADDTPEGLIDMITGCLVLMAAVFVFAMQNPKLVITELKKFENDPAPINTPKGESKPDGSGG